MSKRYWSHAAELDAPAGAAAASTQAEFGPDVARAIAELRARHGIDNGSCEPEGDTPAELDRLRAQIAEAVPGVNRRNFLRLSGAAAVFALSACGKKHPDTVVPWVQQPEGTTLGNALYYSTTLRDSGQPVAVMVKTYDGRPIKIEGNDEHPLARGRCDTRTQAALLNLYDPDRLQDGPHRRDGDAFAPMPWADLDAAVGKALAQGGVGLLTGPIDSPAHKRLITELGAAFGNRFRHAVLEAFPRRAEARARELAFGDATLPHYRADQAAVLVSFGDFLGTPEHGLAEQVEFGELRRLKGQGEAASLGQVIAFEPVLSQLGTCADVRVRVCARDLAVVAWGIAEAVAKQLGTALPASVSGWLRLRQDQLARSLAAVGDVPPIEFAAARLLDARKAGRRSLVWAGGANLQGDDSLPLHLAVAFLNSALGNEGATVVTGPRERTALGDTGAGEALIDAAAAGDVQTLIVCGANPAFTHPVTAAKLAKVTTLVVLADRIDETAALARFVAPTLHGLESWGDAEARPGIYSLQQPCIAPLWDCRAAEESLMAFAVAAGGESAKPFAVEKSQPNAGWRSVVTRRPLWQAAAHGVLPWQEFVRRGWADGIRAESGSSADAAAFWNAALARGALVVPLRVEDVRSLAAIEVPEPARAASGTQLVLTASRMMRDGAALNNAWLQEMPDPVSKICWDPYLAVSPQDAQNWNLATDDVVTLRVGSQSVKVAVHVQEGQDPDTIELMVGWGRARAGEVAALSEATGGFRVDGFALTAQRPLPATLVADISRTGERYQLANPQGHDYMEGRPIALDEVVGKRGTGDHGHPTWKNGTDASGNVSAYGSHHAYPGHKWGMTVDMNTCIGCNACVVACNAENNVPVVGRDEVRKNRVMHWIRIHRYYSGTFDPAKGARAPATKPVESLLDVEAVHQPMLCQQCDNAPCEPVCPANATMHNNEGISLQIYNRCVGTRYCANNCPYKVRRFNWYEYSAYRAGPIDSGRPMTRIVKNLATSAATSAPEELSQAPLQMLLNPEVTVRNRGVMEKCNFCIQRTRTIRDREKAENRRIRDGEITTACAQTCPTKALVFGDLNDPQAEVVQLAERVGTGYRLLDHELNTKPAVTYLKRVRNRPATADEAAPAGHGNADGHGSHGGEG